MIISYAGKTFEEIQHVFLIKIVSNLIEGIYEKPRGNIILNCKDWTFSPQDQDKARMSILITSTHVSVEVPAGARQQERT